MDELLEDQEHEIYCGCNGGWYNITDDFPDSLCIIDADGKCLYCGRTNGERGHTTKCMMIMFPDHDSLTEKRRRSIPDDAVVEGAGMATKRTCPKCRNAYMMLVNYEHGDNVLHTPNGMVQPRIRDSNIIDPEIAVKAIADGFLKPRKQHRDERPTLRADTRWR